MARRAPTIDPILVRLRAEIHARLARTPGVGSGRRVRLAVGDLTIDGRLDLVEAGGVFVRCDVLVESGEHGVLWLGDGKPGVPVRTIFSRCAGEADHEGMGLAFELTDAHVEMRVLELIQALLDAHCVGHVS